MLAQGRYWRVTQSKGCVVLEVLKASLPEDLSELRELRIEVPLERWDRVVKYSHSDRKLLGGVLLDFANHKERLSTAIGSDRLLPEFQRVVLEATAALVDEEILVLTTAEGSEE
jgi:hypothetical protein